MRHLVTGQKAKRAEAFETVKRIREGLGVETRDLDALLLYFAPPVPKVAKTPLEWVAKAAGDDVKRPWMAYIFVRKGYAMATDGHRAHRCKTDKADGYYHPATMLQVNEAAVGGEFPAQGDFDRVWPRLDACRTVDVADLQLCVDPAEDGKDKTYPKLWTPDREFSVNRSYMLDALNGATSGPAWYQPSNAITGGVEFGDYVIMGMRV